MDLTFHKVQTAYYVVIESCYFIFHFHGLVKPAFLPIGCQTWWRGAEWRVWFLFPFRIWSLSACWPPIDFCSITVPHQRDVRSWLRFPSGSCPKTTTSFGTNSCLCFLRRSHLTTGWLNKVAPGKVIQLLGGRQGVRYSVDWRESGEPWESPPSKAITSVKGNAERKRYAWGGEIIINVLFFSLFKSGALSFSLIFLENRVGPPESGQVAVLPAFIFHPEEAWGLVSVCGTWVWLAYREMSAYCQEVSLPQVWKASASFNLNKRVEISFRWIWHNHTSLSMCH